MIKASQSDLTIVTIEQEQYRSVLTTPAQPVAFPLSAEDQQFVADMKDFVVELGGVGLAAPQVNVSKQIIVIYIPEMVKTTRANAEAYPVHALINPSFKPTADAALVEDFEACYSVTETAGKVLRHSSIEVTYTDEQGETHTSIESGFYARALQHEIDHLNGVLFLDHLTADSVQGSREEIRQLRQQEQA